MNTTSIRIFCLMLLTFFLLACGEESTPTDQENSTTEASPSSTPDSEVSSNSNEIPILGRWELVEKQVPDVGEIPLGDIFYYFSAEGAYIISHEDETDVETSKGSFQWSKGTLEIGTDTYQITRQEADTLVLQTSIDGIAEINILVRR